MIVLWTLTAWCCVGVALALLARDPALASAGFGHAALPSFVHLITLGVVLSTHYAEQAARWTDEDAGDRSHQGALPRLLAQGVPLAIWGFHVPGVAVFALGLGRIAEDSGAAAYLGGHYLLPTAIALSVGTELLRGWRRGRARQRADPRTEREPAWRRHAPAGGLLLAMSLGVMLLVDRLGGGYGFYGPPQIALHALAAAFLFVLPVLAPDQPGARAPRSHVPLAGAPWPVLLAGFGLFAFVLDARAFGGGFIQGVPLGLALLGAVGLWVGVPPAHRWRDPSEWARRLPWALFGVLLLRAALGAWRGWTLAEALPWASATALWFLLGVAAPGALARLNGLLERRSTPPPAAQAAGSVVYAHRNAEGARWVMLVGALAVLAGRAAAAEPAVQAGAGLWLAGWAGLAWAGWKAVRERCETGSPEPGHFR